MSLAGLEFVFFLPVVLALYWLGPKRAIWQNSVLLLASIVFYATWNLSLLWILGLAVAVSYGAGLVLGALPPGSEDGGAEDADLANVAKQRLRKTVLTVAVVAELGVLGLFKYAGFFTESMAALLGTMGLSGFIPIVRLALPLGISYTTLIQVGYLLEVYWERAPVERDPVAYATFVAFFPQLLAGPIVRTRQMLPQYGQARYLFPTAISGGASAFLLGFFLKAFVADWLGPNVVNPVFAEPANYSALSLWAALFGYATQLFGDFAGYSLMAIGTGRLFGIELPENFRYPFLSKSLAEFWRRWHITLNTWLFDYIFAPLTTGRSWFRGRSAAGFLVVFLVSGLWHGASWTFIAWGLAHGIALAIHFHYDVWYKKQCRRDRAFVARRRSFGYVMVSWFVTQIFFVFTLIPFRAPDIGRAWDFLRGMVGFGGDATTGARFGFQAAVILASFLMLHFFMMEKGLGPRIRDWFFALPGPVRGIVYGLIVVFLFVYVPVGASTFIYAQF